MKIEEAIYCLKAQSERYSEVCEECPLYGQTGVDHCCEDALQLAITALQNQPVWTSVKKRLLEPYQEIESHKQTNADRIRSFSDEELAEFIEQVSTDSMETISFGTKEYEEIWEHKETALQWLQSEVEE